MEQEYLAQKKQPPHKGPQKEPRHGPTVGSYGMAVSHERGTPVGGRGSVVAGCVYPPLLLGAKGVRV